MKRPQLGVALVFLTLTVAVVAWRISLDSGLRRVEALTREGLRLYDAARREKPGGPLDPAAVEERVAALSGARVTLPRDAGSFTYQGVSRGRVGRTPAAVVRFASGGRMMLLVVVGHPMLRGPGRETAFFAGGDLISGEREGRSFVFWERGGTTFLLVSDGDLTDLFDLVRRRMS